MLVRYYTACRALRFMGREYCLATWSRFSQAEGKRLLSRRSLPRVLLLGHCTAHLWGFSLNVGAVLSGPSCPIHSSIPHSLSSVFNLEFNKDYTCIQALVLPVVQKKEKWG